jgi:hypothetical protein
MPDGVENKVSRKELRFWDVEDYKRCKWGLGLMTLMDDQRTQRCQNGLAGRYVRR